jgi:hypothetical protein
MAGGNPAMTLNKLTPFRAVIENFFYSGFLHLYIQSQSAVGGFHLNH